MSKPHVQFKAVILAIIVALMYPAVLMAQDVEVLSATPDYAVQGSENLEVRINGNGFEKGASVRFFLFDTEQPGGIEVVGDVIVRGSKTIIARINVDKDAVVDDYNIEVTLLSGRRGKGTTRLFAVKSNEQNLVADFCLDFNGDPQLFPAFSSDGQSATGTDGLVHDYCNSKTQRVSLATGSGPGFNFQSYDRSRGTYIRTVRVDFPGGGITAKVLDESGAMIDGRTFLSGSYNMLYRFDQDEGGLDFGSLLVGESGLVSVFMALRTPDIDFIRLAHGSVPNPGTSQALYGNECVKSTSDAYVTRTGKRTWTIESYPGTPNVCLWDFEAGLENQPGVLVSMPYKFTLTSQP